MTGIEGNPVSGTMDPRFVAETEEEKRKTNNGGFVFSVAENTLTELLVKVR